MKKYTSTASCRVRLSREWTQAIQDTIQYYQNAVSWLIPVAQAEYDSFSMLKANAKMTHMEKLVHSTSKRKAKYKGFDKKFYKMPSYLRRSALVAAIGIVSSFMSNLENWKKNGMKGKKPKLRINHSKMPCFYKGNMFKTDEAGESCQIKLRSNGDWAFFSFFLKKTDMEYIRRHYDFEDASAPTLERAGRGYALRFAFEKQCVLEEEVHRICAVDLGMNSDAVLSVMDAEGTVSARKFISCTEEKDRLHALLDRIGKQQSSGNRKNKKLWAYAQHMNEEICRKTVIETIRFAREHGCGGIVMEHLNFSKGMKGSRRQKFHHWRHRSIVQKTEYKAHLNGMRFSTVNAWNTSRLAFDGTGKVLRGKEIRNGKIPKVYGLCEFPSGKIYNCDLNASYNIGARYFIRQKTNKLDAREKTTIGAKVPQTKTRTSQTLDTLRQLNAVLRYA